MHYILVCAIIALDSSILTTMQVQYHLPDGTNDQTPFAKPVFRTHGTDETAKCCNTQARLLTNNFRL